MENLFRIVGQQDFNRERQRLSTLMERFCARGREASDGVVHSFFGRLSSEELARAPQGTRDPAEYLR